MGATAGPRTEAAAENFASVLLEDASPGEQGYRTPERALLAAAVREAGLPIEGLLDSAGSTAGTSSPGEELGDGSEDAGADAAAGGAGGPGGSDVVESSDSGGSDAATGGDVDGEPGKYGRAWQSRGEGCALSPPATELWHSGLEDHTSDTPPSASASTEGPDTDVALGADPVMGAENDGRPAANEPRRDASGGTKDEVIALRSELLRLSTELSSMRDLMAAQQAQAQAQERELARTARERARAEAIERARDLAAHAAHARSASAARVADFANAVLQGGRRAIETTRASAANDAGIDASVHDAAVRSSLVGPPHAGVTVRRMQAWGYAPDVTAGPPSRVRAASDGSVGVLAGVEPNAAWIESPPEREESARAPGALPRVQRRPSDLVWVRGPRGSCALGARIAAHGAEGEAEAVRALARRSDVLAGAADEGPGDATCEPVMLDVISSHPYGGTHAEAQTQPAGCGGVILITYDTDMLGQRVRAYSRQDACGFDLDQVEFFELWGLHVPPLEVSSVLPSHVAGADAAVVCDQLTRSAVLLGAACEAARASSAKRASSRAGSTPSSRLFGACAPPRALLSLWQSAGLPIKEAPPYEDAVLLADGFYQQYYDSEAAIATFSAAAVLDALPACLKRLWHAATEQALSA